MPSKIDDEIKEKLVKQYLLLGRSRNSIGKKLKIAPLTVAKIMEKLIQSGELSETIIEERRELRKRVLDVIVYDLDVKFAATELKCEETDVQAIMQDILEDASNVEKRILEKNEILKSYILGRSRNSVEKYLNMPQSLVNSVRDKLIKFNILSPEQIEERRKLRIKVRDIIIYGIDTKVAAIDLGCGEDDVKDIINDILNSDTEERRAVLKKQYIVESLRLGRNYNYVAKKINTSRESLEVEVAGMYGKGFISKEESKKRRKLRVGVKQYITEGKSMDDIVKFFPDVKVDLIQAIFNDINDNGEIAKDQEAKLEKRIKERLSKGYSIEYIADKEGLTIEELKRMINMFAKQGEIDLDVIEAKRKEQEASMEQKDSFDDKILEHVLLGRSYIYVASEFGVTKLFIEKSIMRSLSKNKVTRQQLEEIRKMRTRIRDLLEKGKNEGEIAGKLGLTRKKVKEIKEDLIRCGEMSEKMVNEAREKADKKKKDKKERESIIIEGLKIGIPMKEIAANIGVTSAAISQQKKKLVDSGLIDEETIILARTNRKDVIRMLDNEGTVEQIAYELGLPEQIVFNIQKVYLREKNKTLKETKKADDEAKRKRKWIELVVKINGNIDEDKKVNSNIRDLIRYTVDMLGEGLLEEGDITTLLETLQKSIYFIEDDSTLSQCYKLIISSYIELKNYTKALRWCNIAMNSDIEEGEESEDNFRKMGKKLSKTIKMERIFKKLQSKYYSWSDIGELAKEEGISEIEAKDALGKYFGRKARTPEREETMVK